MSPSPPSAGPPSSSASTNKAGASVTASLLPSYSSNEQEAIRKLITKPLVKHHDMGPEMYAEAVELITIAVDKHANSKNYEAAATMVKNTFDKKFGNYWHVAIGEGFGFEVTHQQRHLMYVLFGTLGVLCYKM